MGWLTTDYARLEISMKFDLLAGLARGAARFLQLTPHPVLNTNQLCIAVATMHYARILVAHAETREPLFARVGRAAKLLELGSREPLFEEWSLSAGGKPFRVWPWTISEPDELKSPTVYRATLQGSASDSLYIHLKMAWGQERVLAPASALIPIQLLGTRFSHSDAVRLGRTLSAVNAFYGTPQGASRVASEPHAMASALPVLLAA